MSKDSTYQTITIGTDAAAVAQGVVVLTANSTDLAVIVDVVNISGGAEVRFGFDDTSVKEHQGDVFPMRVAEAPVSFLLKKSQTLYVGADAGVVAIVSFNAYAISPEDVPYLI